MQAKDLLSGGGVLHYVAMLFITWLGKEVLSLFFEAEMKQKVGKHVMISPHFKVISFQ